MAFTAAQIPNIMNRTYPPELAGKLYPKGIFVYPEDELVELINDFKVDEVFFSYSDVSHEYVMHKASQVLSAGASFILLGPKVTMLESKIPVVSICAARTGSGKSPTSRFVVSKLKERGMRVVVVRHPMPYGNLIKQVIQRFEDFKDLDKYECSIEEREDYEPHLERGAVVYSGLDYEKILEEVEKEADIIIWDGGNNDMPFYKPNVHIVLVDPHRAGHEKRYHPGETNVRMANVVVINKVDTASSKNIEKVKKNVRKLNPKAVLVKVRMPMTMTREEEIRGRRVLVVEDGPTLTHGEMSFGAATLKAIEIGAEIIDPRPYSIGSITEAYKKYSHLGKVLPAIGYSELQMLELQEIINKTPCEYVLLGTPTDIGRYLDVDKPVIRVRYEIEELIPGELEKAILEKLKP